jgi:hypothetical protein
MSRRCACEFLRGIGPTRPARTGVKPNLTPFATLGLTPVMILAAIFQLPRATATLCPLICCWEGSRF